MPFPKCWYSNSPVGLINDLNDVSILGSIFVAYVLITLKSSLAGTLTPGTWLMCPFNRQCRLQYEWCGFHYIVYILSTFIWHLSLLCIYRNYFMMGFNFVVSVLVLFCWLLHFAFHGHNCLQSVQHKKKKTDYKYISIMKTLTSDSPILRLQCVYAFFSAPMLTDQSVHTARGWGPAVRSRSSAAIVSAQSLFLLCCMRWIKVTALFSR